MISLSLHHTSCATGILREFFASKTKTFEDIGAKERERD